MALLVAIELMGKRHTELLSTSADELFIGYFYYNSSFVHKIIRAS